jgi:hypothetical protein
MRVIENREFSRRTRFSARLHRVSIGALNRMLRAFVSAWQQAFPVHHPDGPDAPPNIAKAAVLREGALLSEETSAIGDKRVA